MVATIQPASAHHPPGGGLKNGGKDLRSEYCAEIRASLARAGVAVVTPDYRLSPMAKYPAYVDDAAAAFAEIGQAHAGTGNTESRHKLMHRTQTLDYGIVTEGEVWLVLDEEEVHLKRGDVVVQRGTNHAWSNRTDAMARMVFILLDGRYAAELNDRLGASA